MVLVGFVDSVFSELLWSCAMQNAEGHFEQDDLAEIWRSAQHRRTEDVGGWLTKYVARWRSLKSRDDRPQYPQAQVRAPGRKTA